MFSHSPISNLQSAGSFPLGKTKQRVSLRTTCPQVNPIAANCLGGGPTAYVRRADGHGSRCRPAPSAGQDCVSADQQNAHLCCPLWHIRSRERTSHIASMDLESSNTLSPRHQRNHKGSNSPSPHTSNINTYHDEDQILRHSSFEQS